MLFDSIQSRNTETILEGQEHVIEGISVITEFLSESVRYDEEVYNLKANVLKKGLVHTQGECTSDEFVNSVNNSASGIANVVKLMHRNVFESVQRFEEFLQKAEVRFYSNCGNLSKRRYGEVNYSSTLMDYKIDRDTVTKMISYIEESLDARMSDNTVDCCTTGASKYLYAYADICDDLNLDPNKLDLSIYRSLREGEVTKDSNDAESMIEQLCDFDCDYEVVETAYNAFERVYYKLQGILNSGAFVSPDFANSFSYNRFSALVTDYMSLLKLFAKITLHVIEAVVERRNSYEHALVYEIMRGE